MSTNRSSPARNESCDGDIAIDLFPFLRVYKDGRIKKFVRHTFVPASEEKSPNGIVTKDVVVDDKTGVSVRLFLPVDAAAAATAAGRRLPLVVYIHGGGFCTGSASAPLFHRYAESLAARAKAVVVSVDYRLAPEHPMPAGHDDAWAALRWVVSRHSDPWVANYADTTCMFLAGESAGANIVHNISLRAAGATTANAGGDGGAIDIEGIILLQPCFWGTKRLPCEKPESWRTTPEFLPEKMDALWPFVTAGAAGNDDQRMNPPPEAIASLPCRRALVTVAEDILQDRGRQYAARLRDGAWGGEVTFLESKGEDHCFHLSPKFNPKAVELMDHVVEFIAKGKTTTPTSLLMTKQRRHRCTLHGTGTEKKTSSAVPSRGVSGGPRCTAQTVPKVQHTPSKAHKYDSSAAGLERSVVNSCL